MQQNQDSLHRIDLNDGDKLDLEELKSSLTDSLESRLDEFSPTSIATSSLPSFDTRVPKVTQSAPASPSRLSVRVRNLVQDFERSVVRANSTSALATEVAVPVSKFSLKLEPSVYTFLVEKSAIMSDLKVSLVPYSKSRASQKGWVTHALKNLEGLNSGGTLTLLLFHKQENLINSYLNKLNEIEDKIAETYDQFEVPVTDPDRSADGDATYQFITETQSKLAVIEARLHKEAPSESSGSNDALVKALGRIGSNPTEVKLSCDVFRGDESDRLKFRHWLAQFEAVINSHPNWVEEAKLNFLKSRLRDLEAPYVTHISGEGGYAKAIERLKEQYLDVPQIRDELLGLLVSKQPAYDTTYSKTSYYLAEMRNLLQELKDHCSVDLITESSGGYFLASHIVFSKLSGELRSKLRSEVGNQYPLFNDILSKSKRVIDSLIKDKKIKSEPKNGGASVERRDTGQSAKTTLNFATSFKQNNSQSSSSITLHCRFCNTDGHSNVYCPQYTTFEQRKEQCLKLNLCTTCSSLKHSHEGCPGKNNKLYNKCRYCRSRAHTSALCPNSTNLSNNTAVNICLNTLNNSSNFLLPVIEIGVQGSKGPKVKFNALLDTGSSRSYLSKSVMK